jgi:hypothetical protein
MHGIIARVLDYGAKPHEDKKDSLMPQCSRTSMKTDAMPKQQHWATTCCCNTGNQGWNQTSESEQGIQTHSHTSKGSSMWTSCDGARPEVSESRE